MKPDIGEVGLAIELDHVSAGYGRQAMMVLNDFSLQFEKGLIYVLLGPNGCGKSTLLMTICGMIPITSGCVTFDTPSGRAAGTIEYVPQNYREALFPWKTVTGNINCWSQRGDFTAQRDLVRAAVNKTGLQALQDQFPADLSGGQQQLILLARCLVAREPNLILDEPFSALDIARRFQLVSLLRNCWREAGKTIICSVHEAEIAARLADRIVVLNGPPLWIQAILKPGDYSTKETLVEDIIQLVSGSAKQPRE